MTPSLPLPLRPTSTFTCHHSAATAKTRRRPPPPSSAILLHPLPSRTLHFLSRPPISSGRCRAAALQPPSWPTEAFVSDHLPRPIDVLVLLDHGLTSSAFPKCNSSSPGRNLFCPPLPPLWPAGFFLADHCPRPIAIVLFPDHSLPSLAKCNSSTSSPCRPPLLLPVTATDAVAGLILPLRSLSPTHPRPPPPGPRLDFPGVSISSPSRNFFCRRRRRCGRPDSSSPITVPDPSLSSSSLTTACLPRRSATLPLLPAGHHFFCPSPPRLLWPA